MKDAAVRRFDAVLCFKLDRFGRSVRNCIEGIEALRAHGVRFLAISQSIDTDESNPTSRLLLHILASVAEFERELIRERVRAGVRNAKHRGKRLGRRRAAFDTNRAAEMHVAGASVREIAQTLGVGRGTVHRFLVSQKRVGSAPAKSL
jgi:DNA invertase Pin-like site-specific DNA recombinase